MRYSTRSLVMLAVIGLCVGALLLADLPVQLPPRALQRPAHPSHTPEPPAPPRNSPFGLNSHVASRYPDFATLDQPLALGSALEVGWVREDVQWSRVEPRPGVFDWSWHDRVFAAHHRHGINIIGVIGPAVGWATPEPNDQYSGVSFFGPDPDRYAAFAKALAERYRGVVSAWEIWNEPENPGLWQPRPEPERYARLLKSASAAIKAVDPSVPILNGGVVPYDPTFLDALATHGAWDAFDVLSIHAYVDPFTPESAQIGVVGITNVVQLAAKYGAKPIWVTEYGWGTGACERDPQGLTDEEAQANYLVRAAVLLRSAGAERVLWYNFKDHPKQPCYGVVRGGAYEADYGSPKPSAEALRVLTRALGAAEPLGMRDFMRHELVLGFEDSGWGAPFPRSAQPLETSGEQVHAGSAAGRISYQFTSIANDYVAFPRSSTAPLPAHTTRVGLWVYGDGSGNIVHLRLVDEEGEVLQYRLGFIGAPGWHFLSTSITGSVERGNRITDGNGRLDGTFRVRELVVDDHPDTTAVSGTIYVDDLIAYQGPEVYAERFQSGTVVIDVVWALAETTVRFPAETPVATVTDRSGQRRTVFASDGELVLTVGPAPVYVRYAPPDASP